MKHTQRIITQLHAIHTTDASVWSIIEFFEPHEFNHPARLDPLLLILLDNARWAATHYMGKDIVIDPTSDFRAGDDGSHGQGWGVDIRAKDSRTKHGITSVAAMVGFSRYGCYCDDDHIHLDVADYFDPTTFPPQVTWFGRGS